MPRVVDHEARRREFAEAIWYVTASEGLEAVTFRSVAAAAGVSVGRIQHYFANKEAMLRYGCEAMIAVAAEAYRQSAVHEAGSWATTPLAALHALVTHAIPVAESQKVGTAVWYAYLAHSVNDPEIAAILRAAKDDEEAEGVRLLQAVQAAGEVAGNREAPATVRALLCLADGLALGVFIGKLDGSAALAVLEEEFGSRLGASGS